MDKLNRKSTTKSLQIMALAILSLLIVACGADSEITAALVGLRPEAVADLVEQDAGDTAAETTTGEAIDTIGEEALEAETILATAPAAAGNGQARLADRSDHVIDPDNLVQPSAAEIAGLVYMRQEEKLARDVYLTLYEQWGQPIFQNIAGSEQAHMDSVLMLLEQYGVADPAAGNGPGEFDDPFFQSLYDDLLAQGNQSQVDALRVGAAIEELDIIDLQERLAQTDNEFIVQVYSNLLAGSENHLRAFVSNLERQGGGVYEPLYLDQDAYQAIIAGASGNGGGYRGGSGSGNDNGSGGNGNDRQNGRGNNA